MNEVLVIGHRNPDTDSICSAIAYAEFKRRTGMPQAVAARCGDTNERTNFVLRKFNVPPPRFVADVSRKVRDVMQSHVISVLPTTTTAEALAIMDERRVRVMPVLTGDRHCVGLISVFKMSKFFFPALNRIGDSRQILASLSNLARTLNAEIIHATDTDREEDLILMVGAMSEEAFLKRMVKYPAERLVVVVGDRVDIQRLAIRRRVRVVVVTGGLLVDQSVVQEARENGVSLMVSPHDSATTALLSRASITVNHMIHERFLTFREDETLSDIQSVAAASNFQAFPVLDENRRTVGILSKSDFLKMVDRKLILVDHNELSQAVQGAGDVEIIEVVDHHRIGLTTQQPILFRNEPVGSTSTIVAQCFFREGIELPRPIAGLLLAGLISDTLLLTSPTATETDANVLSRLEERAGVRAKEFAEQLFASGSVLISRPADQAILADCKEYVECGRRFSVAQIEEVGFEQFWARKAAVFEALQRHRKENDFYFSSLLVTDLVSQDSLLLIAGGDGLARAIDYPKVEDGIYELKGVVSRKKQLLPYLTHTLHGIASPGV